MKITILTLFPNMFDSPFNESIVKHAQEKGLLEIQCVNIRDFGEGKHKTVDDRPYGGGVGMVMRVDIIDKAIRKVKDQTQSKTQQLVVLLDARGMTYTQKIAQDFTKLQHLILICGHYEGVDERVRNLVDMTISVGDFILTGGEIPSMLITDSVARLITGVLKPDATQRESFSNNVLEYPQYTNPRVFQGELVPDILLSGNHKAIENWRKEKSLEITKKHRPDLLEK